MGCEHGSVVRACGSGFDTVSIHRIEDMRREAAWSFAVASLFAMLWCAISFGFVAGVAHGELVRTRRAFAWERGGGS